jgi:hypothetical protein
MYPGSYLKFLKNEALAQLDKMENLRHFGFKTQFSHF